MSQVITNYQFIKNNDGSLCLCVDALEQASDNPVIYYDGSDRAVFYKSPEHIYVLDGIPAEISPYLAFHNQIQVAEASDKDDITHYTASCCFSHHIPALHP